MYAEDLSLWDQMLIVSALMAVVIGSFYAGLAIKAKELQEDERKRDIEQASHRAATIEAKRASRETWA